MKTSLLPFLAIACISSVSSAVVEAPASEAVAVKVLDQPLPPEGGLKLNEFLSKDFSNDPPDAKFDSYNAENWKKNFETFAAALVKKADGQKLDSKSLRNVLESILETSGDKTVYLPIAAYQTTLDGKPIWIINVRWEYLSIAKKSKKSANVLMHFRKFVFDQKTLKIVGFWSCG